jgi:hypothetical protein
MRMSQEHPLRIIYLAWLSPDGNQTTQASPLQALDAIREILIYKQHGLTKLESESGLAKWDNINHARHHSILAITSPAYRHYQRGYGINREYNSLLQSHLIRNAPMTYRPHYLP